VLLPGFDLVDSFHRMQINGVNGQTVEGIGWQGHDVALAQARDDVIDPVWLGFVGMDAQDLRGQENLPQFPEFTAAKSHGCFELPGTGLCFAL
jgi:hypothetical protein